MLESLHHTRDRPKKIISYQWYIDDVAVYRWRENNKITRSADILVCKKLLILRLLHPIVDQVGIQY